MHIASLAPPPSSLAAFARARRSLWAQPSVPVRTRPTCPSVSTSRRDLLVSWPVAPPRTTSRFAAVAARRRCMATTHRCTCGRYELAENRGW